MLVEYAKIKSNEKICDEKQERETALECKLMDKNGKHGRRSGSNSNGLEPIFTICTYAHMQVEVHSSFMRLLTISIFELLIEFLHDLVVLCASQIWQTNHFIDTLNGTHTHVFRLQRFYASNSQLQQQQQQSNK